MSLRVSVTPHYWFLLLASTMFWVFAPAAAQDLTSSVAHTLTAQANRAVQVSVPLIKTVGPSSITRPLSPTSLNVFNFGPYVFKVQYPAGSNFSGIYMTVAAVPVSQAAFSKRLAVGAGLAHPICAVYAGANGNCVDFQVTCSSPGTKQPIQCPSAQSSSLIDVWTSYDTTQSLINPGFLSSPIGANAWGDTLNSFFMLKVDPTTHGHTKGFSEFVAVALGATNQEGLGEFAWNEPLQPTDPRVFAAGSTIPVSFSLASVQNCGRPVTDATASLSVVQIADAQGNATDRIVFAEQDVFKFSNSYQFFLPTQSFGTGSYALTVYGNAFVSQATYFTLQ
ncbi:MAG TPA: hypothetical protein VGJ21_08535 [Terracidiphilus sp.]|jgi:hypothetical protein